jgi:cytochrome c-type biogenesis protein CcmH/NrfG
VTWLVLLASGALAAVAAFGILRPYRRGGILLPERVTDPLADERAALIRTLRELDDERASGMLSASDHAALRAQTEGRAVAVLRAIQGRDGSGEDEDGGLAAGMRELRSTAAVPLDPANGERQRDRHPEPARRRSPGPRAALALGALLVAGMVVLLIGALAHRAPGGSISGDTSLGAAGQPTGTAAAPDQALGSLERQVAQHPGDITSRLDLAARYVRDGRTGLAALQFTEVIRLDPRDVEARTGLAAIVFAAGHPDDALSLLDDALRFSPHDPEALYQEGIVLLKGLHRPQDAAGAFDSYLSAAPYGAHRDEVRALLAGLSSPP